MQHIDAHPRQVYRRSMQSIIIPRPESAPATPQREESRRSSPRSVNNSALAHSPPPPPVNNQFSLESLDNCELSQENITPSLKNSLNQLSGTPSSSVHDDGSAGGGKCIVDGRHRNSGLKSAGVEVSEQSASVHSRRSRPHTAHTSSSKMRAQAAADLRRSTPSKISTLNALKLQSKALHAGARSYVPEPARRAFIPEQRALGISLRNTNDNRSRGRDGPVAAWMEQPRTSQDHAANVNVTNEALWRATMRKPFGNAVHHASMRRSTHATQRGTTMGAQSNPEARFCPNAQANARRQANSFNRSHYPADVAVKVPGMAILVKRLPDELGLEPWRTVESYSW